MASIHETHAGVARLTLTGSDSVLVAGRLHWRPEPISPETHSRRIRNLLRAHGAAATLPALPELVLVPGPWGPVVQARQALASPRVVLQADDDLFPLALSVSSDDSIGDHHLALEKLAFPRSADRAAAAADSPESASVSSDGRTGEHDFSIDYLAFPPSDERAGAAAESPESAEPGVGAQPVAPDVRSGSLSFDGLQRPLDADGEPSFATAAHPSPLGALGYSVATASRVFCCSSWRPTAFLSRLAADYAVALAVFLGLAAVPGVVSVELALGVSFVALVALASLDACDRLLDRTLSLWALGR